LYDIGFREARWALRLVVRRSTVGFGAVFDAVDSKHLAGLREKKPVVADAQAAPAVKIALEFLNVTDSGPGKA
jgi:hypothetical protein